MVVIIIPTEINWNETVLLVTQSLRRHSSETILFTRLFSYNSRKINKMFLLLLPKTGDSQREN